MGTHSVPCPSCGNELSLSTVGDEPNPRQEALQRAIAAATDFSGQPRERWAKVAERLKAETNNGPRHAKPVEQTMDRVEAKLDELEQLVAGRKPTAGERAFVALNDIATLLSGKEWSASDLEDVAQIVNDSGVARILDTDLMSEDEAIGEKPEREVVSVGWDGHSKPMYRWRDELHLPDHLREVVHPEPKPEQPPALGPTDRTYLLAVTAHYEAGESIADPDTLALFVQALLAHDETGAVETGITTVVAWHRFELDAVEPMELLRSEKPSVAGEVFVRISGAAIGHGFPDVELVGPHDQLVQYVKDHWGDSYFEDSGRSVR